MKRLFPFWIDVFTLVIGIALRAIYSFQIQYSLNWDEAPQALLARQIALGNLFPFVHFQLPYIGAVEQYFLAFFMLIFGPELFAVRLFYFLLSSLSIIISFYIFRRIFPAFWSSCTLAFMALCPPVILVCSLQSYSFGGLILFEAIALLIVFSRKIYHNTAKWLLILGLVSGLALYNNILFVGVFLFCSWSVYKAQSWRGLQWFSGGAFVGYLPMLLFNILNNFITYQILVSKYLVVTRAQVNEQGILLALINGFVDKVTGQTPNYTIQHLYGYPLFFSDSGYPIQYVAFAIIVALLILSACTLVPRINKKVKNTAGHLGHNQLPFYIATALAILSAVNEMRYTTVLVPLIPIIISQALLLVHKQSRTLAIAIFVFLCSYLSLGHYKAFAEYYQDNKTWSYHPFESVYKFLDSHGLQYGYGSYPFQASIAFISGEKIKISPQIGPTYMDKLPHYSQIVDAQDKVFFIVPADSIYLTPLIEKDIDYLRHEIEGWWVLYDFNERVYPIDLIPEQELMQSDGYKKWSYRENPKVLNPFRGSH